MSGINWEMGKSGKSGKSDGIEAWDSYSISIWAQNDCFGSLMLIGV